jgi:hypothetical protein
VDLKAKDSKLKAVATTQAQADLIAIVITVAVDADAVVVVDVVETIRDKAVETSKAKVVHACKVAMINLASLPTLKDQQALNLGIRVAAEIKVGEALRGTLRLQSSD